LIFFVYNSNEITTITYGLLDVAF